MLSRLFLLARDGPLGHVGRPDERAESRRSQACCVGQGCLVGSTLGRRPVGGGSLTDVSPGEGWGTQPE